MTPSSKDGKVPLAPAKQSAPPDQIGIVRDDDVPQIAMKPAKPVESERGGGAILADTAHDGAYYRHEYVDSDDDLETASETSTFSTVSHDSAPPITAYGHTYHASRRLFTPNDASEARRQALQHTLFELCLDGGLTAAKLPLDDVQSNEPYQILDIGSGSGLWAVQMAQTYPHVNILGTDLSSALLPSDVPSNLTFEIADAAGPWPPHRYDFIHMRNLVGGGIRDWDRLLRDAYAHLKPGGQLEFTDIRPRFFDVDPELADLPSLSAGERPEIGACCLEYERIFTANCIRMGLDLDPTPRVADYLSGVIGADSVRERVDWVPLKSWGSDPLARRKGAIVMEIADYLENWTLMLFGTCGWSEEDTRAMLARVIAEIRHPVLRSCAKVTFITARKPWEDE